MNILKSAVTRLPLSVGILWARRYVKVFSPNEPPSGIGVSLYRGSPFENWISLVAVFLKGGRRKMDRVVKTRR